MAAEHRFDAADRRWMRAALALASRAVGRVAPNPAVAALIVRHGRLIARGVTAPGGRPHAEAIALEAAAARGIDVAGATAYVTLEPCAHHGRTPPCAEALAVAGITRLVCPLEDPDPRVSGAGFARLAAAGVTIDVGLCAEQAAWVNAAFLSRIERGRPHLTLKLATTLDGRIATASGESRWITGAAARRKVHLMRARSDAVLVGAGTARADDPMLDVRGFGAHAAQPVRVVVDPGLSLSLGGRLAQSARRIPVILAHRDDPGIAVSEHSKALSALGVTLMPCPPAPSSAPTPSTIGGEPDITHQQQTGNPPNSIDLEAVLAGLAQRGIGSVLCEGGAVLASGLIAQSLVDRLVLFSAGKMIGAEGQPAVGSLALSTLAAAPQFHLVECERLGEDTVSIWEPKSRPGNQRATGRG
ncbi:MAG: bifunctional diaminohydroxyphosphoribosylaminopyrimidine deaminase/5-amino-6-(5-phosphoribosylamino)uracil reductase RibD [Pseudomonadota bacterium]